MKRKLLSILALLCLAVSGAWAESVNCQPEDIGKLLGSDGNVYATATDFPDGVTVSGMIAYINTSEHWGLAIGPVDLNSGGTHGSEKVNQSTAVTVCSGYNRELPAAASTGWRLPSQDDFNKMIGTDGCLSADNLRQLKGRQENSCANDAGIWGMLTTDGYWSSTETETAGVYYNLWANDCTSVANGTLAPKYVRPCFTFSVSQSGTFAGDVQYYDVTVTTGSRMKTITNPTAITSATTALAGSTGNAMTWFYVSGNVTCENRIVVSGNVAIILEDGCTFTANKGIQVHSGQSLSIYAQSAGDGCGKLIAAHASYNVDEHGNDAAIGGNGGEEDFNDGRNAGVIKIFGGDITASSIGGGNGCEPYDYSKTYGGKGGNITIAGGSINVSEFVGGGYNTNDEDEPTYTNTDFTFHLAWTNSTDRIYIKQYHGSPHAYNHLYLDRPFTDGEHHYVVTENNFNFEQLNGKTLLPDGTCYAITIGGPSPECVTAGAYQILEGDDVTLRPTNGYTVGTVTVKDENNLANNVTVTKNNDGTWSFTMPAFDVIVQPSDYTRTHYLVSYGSDVNIVSATSSLMQGDVTTYKSNSDVVFSVTQPKETYSLQSIDIYKTGDGTKVSYTQQSPNYKFTMPEYDVTISPVWTVSSHSISYSGNMSLNVLSPTTGGTEEINGHTYYKEGTSVQVTITPPTNRVVTGFTIINDETGENVGYYANSNTIYTFTVPAADVTITAIYDIDLTQLDLLSGTDDFRVTWGWDNYNHLYSEGGVKYTQGCARLLDGLYSSTNSAYYTKWCATNFNYFDEDKRCFVKFQTNEPVIPKHYVLITGDDNETVTGRNPKSWIINAKANESDNWTTIAVVNNDETMQDVNYTAYTFDFNNPDDKAYQYFQFMILENHGATAMQLSEMQMWVKNTQTLTAKEHDGNYWTTFYDGTNGYKFTNNENACAYTATVDKNTVTLHKLGKVIPAGTAAIIVGEDSNVSLIASNEAAEYTVSNDLRGSDSKIARPATGITYILSKKDDDFGFFEYTGENIPAHKAYLYDNSSNLARELTMVFGDEAGVTPLLSPEGEEGASPRGGLVGVWYSLDGRRLSNKPSQRGVYINNGRKIVVQ